MDYNMARNYFLLYFAIAICSISLITVSVLYLRENKTKVKQWIADRLVEAAERIQGSTIDIYDKMYTCPPWADPVRFKQTRCYISPVKARKEKAHG